MSKTVAVVLPTYNEGKNIKKIMDSVFKHAISEDYKLKILVVDDNSPDGTADIARGHAKKNKYDVLVLPGKKEGLGKAYIRAFTYIEEKEYADIVIMMDADLSHDAREIPGMIAMLENSDLVIGSRYVDGGMIAGNWPVVRVINSRVARFVSRFVGGLTRDIQDPATGFRAFRISTIKDKNLFEKGKVSGYVFMASMSNAFSKAGLSVAEIPIKFQDRTDGSSKIRINDIMEYFTYCYNMNEHTPLKNLIKNTLEWMAIIGSYFIVQMVCEMYPDMNDILGIILALQGSMFSLFALKFDELSTFRKYGFPNRWVSALVATVLLDVVLCAMVVSLVLASGVGYIDNVFEATPIATFAGVIVYFYWKYLKMSPDSDTQTN